MKIQNETIHHDRVRDIRWTKITFLSDDNTKKTIIFTAASWEYLSDYYKISSNAELTDEHLNNWVKRVNNKWETHGDEILKHPIHYDVYANNPKGEANITDFLLKKINGAQ